MTRFSFVEYERFVKLAEADLCAYMDPFVADSTTEIPDDVLKRMLSESETYDEYHLVYALTLGAKHCPTVFAAHLPKYLADKRDSVYCAAVNMLDQLPNECLTQELVDSIRASLRSIRSRSVRKYTCVILENLVKRLRER